MIKTSVPKRSISFCTVCMNRLEHLKKTLPRNILDNAGYGNVEFVVLDYNSTDGLEKWIAEEMAHYIDQGLLVFFKYKDRDYFHRSHSRNFVMKLSSGEIICNLDADNYTGFGFADYINNVFCKHQNIFLTANYGRGTDIDRDCFGRLCLERSSFHSVEGFDEAMNGYGAEDMDIYNRLLMLGFRIQYINDRQYLNCISHSNESRIENEKDFLKLQSLLVHQVTPFESHVLKLNKDKTFEYRILLEEAIAEYNPVTGSIISPDSHPVCSTGVYRTQTREIELIYANRSSEMLVQCDNEIWFIENRKFYTIQQTAHRAHMYFQITLAINNMRLNESSKKSNPVVNNGIYGKGKVLKNFKYNVEV